MNKISNMSAEDPRYKQGFDFIKQLEIKNQLDQDKIWERFLKTVGESNEKKKRDNVARNKLKFASHPSEFSSESDLELNESVESKKEKFFRDDAQIPFTHVVKPKSAPLKKPILSIQSRKQLRSKLTQHLQDGTLMDFDVKNVGDSPGNSSRSRKSGSTSRNSRMGEATLKRPKKTSDFHCVTETKVNNGQKDFADTRIVYQRMFGKTESSDGESEHDSAKEDPRDLLSDSMNEEELSRASKLEDVQVYKPKVDKRSPAKTLKDKSLEKAALTKKILYYIEKSVNIIKDIGNLLEMGIQLPDGKEDMERRQHRTKEFASRFSRTYLYTLERHINEVNEKGGYAKYVAAYQSVFHGLQSFLGLIPTAVGNLAHQKLKQCLNHILDLCGKSEIAFRSEKNSDQSVNDHICILRNNCLEMIENLEENHLNLLPLKKKDFSKEKHSLPRARSSSYSVHNFTQRSNVPFAFCKKRFSMYSSSHLLRRERQLHKEMDQEKKNNVKSRYKTATYKHRPPVDRTAPLMCLPGKQKQLTAKRSFTLLRNSPVPTLVDEDNIQTMVQYDKERLGEENKDDRSRAEDAKDEDLSFVHEQVDPRTPPVSTDDILAKLLHLVREDSDLPRAAEDNADRLAQTIIALQQCLDIKNGRLNVSDQTRELEKSGPQITVSGAKNAQLICIKDDSAPTIPDDTVEESTNDTQEKNIEETPKDEEAPKGSLKSRSCITKMSRLQRPNRVLQLLPKEYAISIIQYKLEFAQSCKGNPRYRRTAVRPWELLERISEELFNFALLGIAKEIEVNELLENMYNAEFQY